jgi:hypothetical protein
MKTRDGFVSNSSSSSFIVASDKDAGDIEMSLTLSVRLRDLTEETITTKEELIAHYKDCWGYTTEKEILSEKFTAKEYKRCLVELKKGKKLHVIAVSSDGTPLEAAIYDSGEGKLPSSPDYKVISE